MVKKEEKPPSDFKRTKKRNRLPGYGHSHPEPPREVHAHPDPHRTATAPELTPEKRGGRKSNRRKKTMKKKRKTRKAKKSRRNKRV